MRIPGFLATTPPLSPSTEILIGVDMKPEDFVYQYLVFIGMG